MRTVRLLQPKRIVIGEEAVARCAEDVLAAGLKSLFVVTSPPITGLTEPLVGALKTGGAVVSIYPEIDQEPAIATVEAALGAARAMHPDGIIGLGGGSVMDTAKLVAALYDGEQMVREVFGIDKLASRVLYVACLPTTSGTGSEVSPNAILLDESENLKKGVVSPHLVPDAAYLDPGLTVTLPPSITAATGVDALTHCVEAYANRFAHPVVDVYALQGVRLIVKYLKRATDEPEDIEARTQMMLGSFYGGLCLAPVNTTAVHALSYPLGSEFHVAHGVANAVLLPYVLRYNYGAAPERHAEIARAMGVTPGGSDLQTAERGVERIAALCEACGIPQSIADLGVPEDAIPRMAEAAMKVTRLLRNNLRDLTVDDVEAIYRAAY